MHLFVTLRQQYFVKSNLQRGWEPIGRPKRGSEKGGPPPIVAQVLRKIMWACLALSSSTAAHDCADAAPDSAESKT